MSPRLEATLRQDVSSNENTALIQFLEVPAGKINIVYIPDHMHSPASGETHVVGGQVATVTLILQEANVISGIVLDDALQPVESAQVKAHIDSLFPSIRERTGAFPIYEGGRRRAGGTAGQRLTFNKSRTYALYPDGSLRLGTYTDENGRFRIDSLTSRAVRLTARLDDVESSTVTAPGQEAVLVLPRSNKQDVASPSQAEREVMRARIIDLLQEFARKGSQDQQALGQLKSSLMRAITSSAIPDDEKVHLRKLVQEAGRQEK